MYQAALQTGSCDCQRTPRRWQQLGHFLRRCQMLQYKHSCCSPARAHCELTGSTWCTQMAVRPPHATNGQTGHNTKRRTGSGIYRRPAGHMQDGSQLDELCVRLDPAGQGITNTINRAELAPIEYALREGVGTHIASGSACSLYQIAKMIHRPMNMREHK